MSKLKFTLFFLTIFFGVLFFARSSLAATYYVSPNGTNTWPNCTTQDSPCLAGSTTAGKAFLGAVAGDTVYFLPGTYSPGSGADYSWPAWNPVNSGNAGSGYITFKCLSGTCTLIHTNVSPTIGSNGRNYIAWDGFTASAVGIPMLMVRFDGNINHVKLLNCDFTGFNNYGAGGNNAIVFIQTVDTALIQNNRLHGSKDTSNSTAITTYSMSNGIVENNEVYDCTGGIYDKMAGVNNIYRYNFIHDGYKNIFNPVGFRIETAAGVASNHLYFYQNVVANTGSGIYMEGPLSKTYIYFYNNTVYAGSSNTVEGVHDNIEIFNNIFHTSGRFFQYISGMTNFINNWHYLYNGTIIGKYPGSGGTDYYTLSSWNSATGWDANSTIADPSLVNAGGSLVTDYKRTSYPTNGRGGSYSSVMGAYITGNEVIGYTASGVIPDTTPPAAPSGVVIS